MAGNSSRRAAGSSPRSEIANRDGIATLDNPDWGIIGLSLAGVFFILLGLVILAFPEGEEGILVWQLGPEHALHMMDSIGAFTTMLGVSLTWVSGRLWQRRMAT